MREQPTMTTRPPYRQCQNQKAHSVHEYDLPQTANGRASIQRFRCPGCAAGGKTLTIEAGYDTQAGF